MLKQQFLTLLASLLFSLTAFAQTPVANRIKAVVKKLPKNAIVVAKYTDNERHCLYYVFSHRLYCYDVLTGKNNETAFTGSSYNRVLNTWLSPDGNFFFVAIDKGLNKNEAMVEGQELWKFDSRKKESKCVGKGFKIERKSDGYIIKRVTRNLDAAKSSDKQRWVVQDFHYDLYGEVPVVKDNF